ncbi:MAG: aromatic ring-hydroxylating dioxygenase subunit alpha, partial [Actinomycetota bacterium]|nr:aromatic ring-hydroxylating dioxygenase subunit alpha [Actinomycetota bacterium]
AGTAPERFARGWHCLGLVRDFNDGQPHGLEAFGTKLVIWKGASGDLKVLDSYCRHMGGDLSQGTVVGENVACPFHSWRWGGDGKCQEIPYARRVPPRARTRAWQAMELDGQLFVWHDPEGNPAPEDVTIPAIEGFAEGQWTDWVWDSTVVEGSHCREIIDNMVDMAHFYYIHKGLPTYFKNVFEGHVCTQYYAGTTHELAATGAPIDIGEYEGQQTVSDATYHGPSYLVDKLWTKYGDMTFETVLITCHYPLSSTSFMLNYGMVMKKMPDWDDATNDMVAGKMLAGIGSGFMEDVKIWKNKTRIDNPLLCEEDGPVYQLRRWYEQFYVDVADIDPESTKRFEFEIDTTKAVDFWQKELVEKAAEAEKAEATA